jgi:hypothetical protein
MDLDDKYMHFSYYSLHLLTEKRIVTCQQMSNNDDIIFIKQTSPFMVETRD